MTKFLSLSLTTFLLWTLTLPVTTLSQTKGIRLQHLNTSSGLSQAHVNAVYQDSRGYTWFGTKDGLNRYDGHEMMIYKFDPDNENTISDNYVRSLLEDHERRLWIGTDAGRLNFLDLDTENIRRITLSKPSKKRNPKKQIWEMSLQDNRWLWVATWEEIFKIDLQDPQFNAFPVLRENKHVRCLTTFENGTTWFGTENKGLFKITEAGVTPHALGEFSDNQRIYCLLNDNEQALWIGTANGLLRLDIETNRIDQIQLTPDFKNIEVTSLDFDLNKTLWIGTVEHGLISLDPNMDNPKIHLPSGKDPYGLSDSGILDVYADMKGLLWVATRGAGVQFFDTNAPFSYYGYQPDNPDYLADPSVRAVLTDGDDLWIGGQGGLSKFQNGGKRLTHFDKATGGLNNENVSSLIKDYAGTLWIGTEGGGLFYLNQGMRKPRRMNIDNSNSQLANHVNQLFLSKNASVYLGTGAGLYRLNPDHNYIYPPQKVSFNHVDQHHLDSEEIIAITEDDKGNFYIGTGSAGLYVLDKNHTLTEHYTHDVNDKHSIGNSRIKALHIDQKGYLWVGTAGGGLNKLDPVENIFYHYDENDGLSDNTVYGILEDFRGRFWLSTNKGISLFDETVLSFKNFGLQHGLQSLEFNTGAFHQSQTGEMFFGGTLGLNTFFPEKMVTRPLRLPVVFTAFMVSNKKIKAGNPLLPVEINDMKRLKITHKERLISFKFSAMNFLSPGETRYRYMIPGVDESWVYSEPGNQTATYTDLPAGTQELLVEASQSETDYFGELRRLMIEIKPAPWNSLWARALMLFVVVSILMVIRQNEKKKMKLRVELAQKKQEASKLNEIDDMKSRLISNVSYELRTPLTLLDGHIEILSKSIKSNVSAAVRKNVENAKDSLERVNELSGQLFELARFTAGKIKLQAKRAKLNKLISLIVNEYRSQCVANDLELEFIQPDHEIEVYVDKNKFDQILINLLSNAIKFCDPKSTITIELIDDLLEDDHGMGRFPRIAVSNIGKGIPANALTNIFDRLYQIDTTEHSEKTGAGIGLALVKELVELHGGTITAKSIPGGETRFEFSIPTGTDHLLADEIIETSTQFKGKKSQVTRIVMDPTLLKILIVEDEESMLSFLNEGLEDEYMIFLAENGIEGLEIARKEYPDLIISDVHMPKKNGLDFLRDIRADKELSHTPVIMLTGQTSTDDRLNAYRAAANDFISKPFKLEELKIRIENIIQQRSQLINSLKDEGIPVSIPDQHSSKTDDRFYLRLKTIIEEHIDQSELTVDILAREVYLSKRQLERKLKEITGQSPADLIRQIRLQTARNYIMDGSFATVAEVSYAVGFKNVKYFSRLFKNQFNQSPSDILRN